MKRTIAFFFRTLFLTFVLFEVYFALRIFAMRWVNPESTTWQRTEIYRLINRNAPLQWQYQWVPYSKISLYVKQAIITSEDDSFLKHTAIDWDATWSAWQFNQKSQQHFEELLSKTHRQVGENKPMRRIKPARIIGGSTITQQLAKNLFLTGDKILIRKMQELIFAYELDLLLPKQRIFEIYLNSVEWGSGIFGIDAAAQNYFHVPASSLMPQQAAKIATMLPQPLYLQWRMNSPYMERRSNTILVEMGDAAIP